MEYQELYIIADKIATQCFDKWKFHYRVDAVDYDDVRQESRLYMWKAIEKYKTTKSYQDLKNLAIRASYLRLTALLFRALKYEKGFVQLQQLTDEERKLGFIRDDILSYINPTKPEISLAWIQARDICTDVDFRLLDMKIRKRMNFEEIAHNLFQDKNVTREHIRQRFEIICKRLKKYLTKLPLRDIV